MSKNQKLLWRRIDEVLYYVWDPIGVNDTAYTRDEYTSYVPQVFKLVVENNKHKLAEYLNRTSIKDMGMSFASNATKNTIKLLFDFQDAINEDCA